MARNVRHLHSMYRLRQHEGELMAKELPEEIKVMLIELCGNFAIRYDVPVDAVVLFAAELSLIMAMVPDDDKKEVH